MTPFNREVEEGKHGNLSAIGSWRRKRWAKMDRAEKSTLESYILVAYKGEKNAKAAAAYFGVSVRTVQAALKALARQGEITTGKALKSIDRYIPLLARYTDPDVLRFVNGRRVPRYVVNAKRAWSVWDSVEDNWLPQDGKKRFQTLEGCKRYCDTLNQWTREAASVGAEQGGG